MRERLSHPCMLVAWSPVCLLARCYQVRSCRPQGIQATKAERDKFVSVPGFGPRRGEGAACRFPNTSLKVDTSKHVLCTDTLCLVPASLMARGSLALACACLVLSALPVAANPVCCVLPELSLLALALALALCSTLLCVCFWLCF